MSNNVLTIMQKLRYCTLFFKVLIAVGVTDLLLVTPTLLKCGDPGATCIKKTSQE